ncbi:hypothetical protein DL96DRAFT_1745631 [Flagelloscypha sp. PMI_526]|nr:hypothetical protein DL96DRAFT_1745631 [Flagelloscypha sp. PMI_526]
MKVPSLSISLSLPEHSHTGDTSALDFSFSEAQVSLISSSCSASQDHIVVGSEDGSLYVFKSGPTDTAALPTLTLPDAIPPALSVMSRSRIVSGVTKEQVEAPKNYVDFEDEPEKLKDILKGHAHTPKPSVELGLEKHLFSPVSPSSPDIQPKRPRDEPRSLLSATNSPSYTPRTPLSQPGSPGVSSTSPPSDTLYLSYHARLDYGSRPAVTADWLDQNHLIALQENGHLSIITISDGCTVSSVFVDEQPLQPPQGSSDQQADAGLWKWRRIQVVTEPDATYILITATLDEATSQTTMFDASDTGTEIAKIALYETINTPGLGMSLDKVGEWTSRGLADSFGIYFERSDVRLLAYITAEGKVFTQRMRILPRGWQNILENASAQTNESPANQAQLAIINAFKAMKPRGDDQREPIVAALDEGLVTLDDAHDLGGIETNEEPVLGVKLVSTREGYIRGISWTEKGVSCFECQGSTLRTMFYLSVPGILDSKWFGDDVYCLIGKDYAESFALVAVDRNGDPLTDHAHTPIGEAELVQPQSFQIFNLDPHLEAVHIVSPHELLAASLDKSNRRILVRYTAGSSSPLEVSTIWNSPPLSSSQARLSSIIPLEVDRFVLASTDGLLRQVNFAQLCGTETTSSLKTSSPAAGCVVRSLFRVQNLRTKDSLLIGGGDDGSIVIWSLASFKILARRSQFLCPLWRVYQIQEQSGPLTGCILCVSEDGTIAVIALDGFHFLYLIPGSSAPLISLHLGNGNLLLVYEDSRARLWDVKTRQEDWTTLPQIVTLSDKAVFKAVPKASTILVDVNLFVSGSTTITKGISTSRQDTRIILAALDRLRTMASVLITPGLNQDIDTICFPKLRDTSFTVLVWEAWSVSGKVSAARCLALVAVLKAMELADSVNTVVLFYTTSLPATVGSNFQWPDLTFLAREWFSSSNEIRQAARIVLDAAITRLDDEEAVLIAEQWQSHLPSLQSLSEQESTKAAFSLLLSGYIASEKYSLLSSITLYLHDEQSIYRALAIDLCSRGFHVWQHYVDTMEILRALFLIGTTAKKEAISSQNVGAQARMAVLHIASTNTPLFMTTLSLDVLSPPSLEHRRSVMQMVAFLIRKKPLVLYPNLPRLMEAVVKSLDPNSTSHREAVFDTATEIIGLVVKSFPTVDFNMSSQRLAVEGHKKKIAACSFSPDGRRLLTLSLEESTVLVWKVGTSFSSFFNPGAPPKQGHGGTQPFKTFPFNLGDQAEEMSVTDTFQNIRFEWLGDRSVRLKIRESILTLST